MVTQLGFSSDSFERPHAPTRRERFLQQMESVLSDGVQRSSADRSGANAADIFFATVVRFVGSGDGRDALRQPHDGPLCGARSRNRIGAGRNDDLQVPSPDRGAEYWRVAV